VSTRTSSVLQQAPVSWKARAEEAGGKTSPEELLAAAHASCFVMALSNGLATAGKPPKKLRAIARVTFDKVGDNFRVTTSELEVQGTVPGMDAETFQRAAETAKDGCPISNALKGNVKLSVRATLA
jgi:osmotically inducible protein OsmC